MKKLLFCILTVFCFMLTACKPKEEAKPLVDINMPTLEDTRGTEEKMVTFKTLNGNEVTYNQNTRRIITLMGSQDVVAFGIKLLAYENSTNINGYESYYEGSSVLKNSSPFNSEEILSYNPELILVNEAMTLANINTLSKIAPVIPLYTDSTDFSVRLNYLGEIFGLKDSASKLIKYCDDLKISMINEMKAMGLENKTLTIYTYFGTGISIPPMRGWFMNSIIYDYVGIGIEENVLNFMKDESGIAYAAISDENLTDYEGDLVLFAGFDGASITSYVSEKAGWNRLNAVKENRVGIIDITPYAQKGVILLYNQYMQIFNALKVCGKVE